VEPRLSLPAARTGVHLRLEPQGEIVDEEAGNAFGRGMPK
jgi:hypothetical protein